ncbi:MAG: hypothetical protein P4L48_06940 [Mycobacterium sp.]|nr:hypothetical protein [Mycobacterium sp.]
MAATAATKQKRSDTPQSPHLRPSANVAMLDEASEIPISTLRQWIREGKLPAYKVGHSHRRVRRYLPTADVGWLYGYLGAVAVAADDTISPSVPGVEVCP